MRPTDFAISFASLIIGVVCINHALSTPEPRHEPPDAFVAVLSIPGVPVPVVFQTSPMGIQEYCGWRPFQIVRTVVTGSDG